MNHQFDVEHAILFGLQEAIFINNFQFWLRQNAANERNIRNDKPWTYNTHKAYCKQFPYMTENQIRRVLESLVSKGILEKAKFNDNKYDQTLWYSFTDEFLSQNPLFDSANLPDRSGKKPASHTDKKTDKYQESADKAATSRVKVLQTYLDECKEAGVKPIPDDHYIRTYAEDAGITADMMGLCWRRFVEEHTTGARKLKKYKDWTQTFANCVKDNWFKFWYVKDGEVVMTSQCELFKAAFDAKREKGE